MTYVSRTPAGCEFDVDGMLLPMSKAEGFLDPNSFMRPMLEGVVDAMPCFSSMRVMSDSSGEDAIGSILNGTFNFPLGAEPGNNEGMLIARLRSTGVPLKADAFPPFAYMAGGDASLLPSVIVLLEARDTWLLVEDGIGHSRTCMVYAWEGGKAHYARHPTDLPVLKAMVDADALKAKAAAAPPRPAAPPPGKVEVAVNAAKAAGVAVTLAEKHRPLASALQKFRDAGFLSVGTEDMGPALQAQADDGSTLVVCRGDGPSLAKSGSFLLRKYRDGNLESEQSGMDVNAVLEAVKEQPSAPRP